LGEVGFHSDALATKGPLLSAAAFFLFVIAGDRASMASGHRLVVMARRHAVLAMMDLIEVHLAQLRARCEAERRRGDPPDGEG